MAKNITARAKAIMRAIHNKEATIKLPIYPSRMTIGAVVALAVIAGVSFLMGDTLSQSAAADGGRNGECENADAKVDSVTVAGDLASYTFVGGEIVKSICIKAGSNTMFGDGHSDEGVIASNGLYESDCYKVTGIGTATVTVERIGSGNLCQGISHIDVYAGQATPTTTPTSTPTATPTPTPTPTVTGTGSGGPGDDTDCCPGPDDPVADPVTPQVASTTTSRVAGATTIEQFPATGGLGSLWPAVGLAASFLIALSAIAWLHQRRLEA